MIISFTTAFAIAIAILSGAVLIATTAAWVARCALRQSRAARTTADIAALRVAELEDTLAGCTVQIEALLSQREHERASPARPSLREAVALSRHGASTEELVATCRIGQGEARLIQMLYGTSGRATDAGGATAGVH